MKTYTIRIFPQKEQISELMNLSLIRKDIWNTLIDIEQKEYEINKKIFNNFKLHSLITILKKTTKSEWYKYNSKAIQRIANEIFSSYRSFYQLIKKDKSARPPNKIENDNFHTLVFNQSGWQFRDNILTINKIPFEYKTHLENIEQLDIKEIRVKFRNNKWLVDVCLQEEREFLKELTIQNKILSIDLGLKTLGTGIDTDGNIIVIPNKVKKISKYYSKIINEIKSKQSKTTKGSRRWKHLQKRKSFFYNKKNEQVKQTLHIQSKELANMNYNTIIIGDLSVKRLMLLDTNKYSKISKAFGNSNITMFLTFLKYKCEHKNVNLLKVDEKWTTQINCLTGKKFKNKVELKDRYVYITDDILINRDLNSAINILKRYYNNHLATMTSPFPLGNVLDKYNLSKNLSI